MIVEHPWRVIPRTMLWEFLLLLLIAWVSIAIVKMVTANVRVHRVWYCVLGVAMVLWVTGLVRLAGPSGL